MDALASDDIAPGTHSTHGKVGLIDLLILADIEPGCGARCRKLAGWSCTHTGHRFWLHGDRAGANGGISPRRCRAYRVTGPRRGVGTYYGVKGVPPRPSPRLA